MDSFCPPTLSSPQESGDLVNCLVHPERFRRMRILRSLSTCTGERVASDNADRGRGGEYHRPDGQQPDQSLGKRSDNDQHDAQCQDDEKDDNHRNSASWIGGQVYIGDLLDAAGVRGDTLRIPRSRTVRGEEKNSRAAKLSSTGAPRVRTLLRPERVTGVILVTGRSIAGRGAAKRSSPTKDRSLFCPCRTARCASRARRMLSRISPLKDEATV